MAGRIEDYGMIGDRRSAALVGRDGSVDWCCLPRFDSGACFAALLGDARHGRWLVAPAAGGPAARRAYRGDSTVLDTEFDVPEGRVRVTDLMPPEGPGPSLLRLVEGLAGRVPMRMEMVARFDEGRVPPWVRLRPEGAQVLAGPQALWLRAPVDVRDEDGVLVADFALAAGERVGMALTWAPSHEPAPPAPDPAREADRAVRWWQDWCARSGWEGRWAGAVRRSLVTLKALTFAPTGGVIAAPTTSLPERIGGGRNWDYRFCWLRDATFTLYALMDAGHLREAAAWRDWLLRAAAGHPSELQIMYGPAGERRIGEREATWLPGYEGSRPVRVGNAAVGQRQLDVYGEVVDAMHQARRRGIPPEDAAWDLQAGLLEHLEGAWREPDAGMWEMRGPPRHFTHSRVMAWVAFDRAVKTVERTGLPGPADRWRRARAEVHRDVCERGWDPVQGAFVQRYGAPDLDASLLRMPLVGFLPARDPRVVGTVAAIRRELGRDGLLLRYPPGADGLDGREGAFLPCTFWLVDVLAMQGRDEEARDLFGRLLGLANDLGLLSEEYDPDRRRLVGNFPQAFTHVGLVNSARTLGGGGPARHRSEEDG